MAGPYAPSETHKLIDEVEKQVICAGETGYVLLSLKLPMITEFI